MKRLHYLLTLTILWFFLLYNIERLIAPINIASFAYIYTALCAVLLILLPKFRRTTLVWIIVVSLVVYLFLKRQLGYQLDGANLSLTITELSAVTVTVVLASLIRHRLERLQTMLTTLVTGQVRPEIQAFGSGQGQIYRELRRARRHQRPAALLAISAADEFLNVQFDRLIGEIPLHRFLSEAQSDLTKKYVNTRLANWLVEELDDSAVITQRDDYFITLLPEVDRDELHTIIKNLKDAAENKLSLKLNIGASTFPDRAVTFEALLAQAEANMVQHSPSVNGHVEPSEHPVAIATEAKKLSSAL